jgi:ligand-binding sensor domain-containing protein/signal transduction histidine kinase
MKLKVTFMGTVRSLEHIQKIQLFSALLIATFLLTTCNTGVTFLASTNTPHPAASASSEALPDFYPLPRGALRFEHLSLEEGLSHSSVTAVVQDRFGFLWFGTEDGLNRYDGYSFTIFRPAPDEPNGISDRWITALLEDRNGYLWVGTRLGGLNRYNPETGTFTLFLHDSLNANTLSSNSVTALLEDNLGYLWIGTTNGLNRFDPKTGVFEHFRNAQETPNGLSSNSISALFEDSQGGVWVGTSNNGLNLLNTDDLSFQSFFHDDENPNSLIDNSIQAIVEDNQGFIWVATPAGLNRIPSDKSIFISYTHDTDVSGSLAHNYVYSLYADKAGILWVGTENGLDRYDYDSYTFSHSRHNPGDKNSLSSNSVRIIYEDRGGVLWVGTYGNGLSKFNRGQSKFAYYHFEPDDLNSISSNLIFPIVVDTTGTIWVGTYNGLDRLNPRLELIAHYQNDPTDPGSLLSDNVVSAYMDGNDTLWVGTKKGLSRLDANASEFIHYTSNSQGPYNKEQQEVESIPPDTAYAFLEDSRETILWIGKNISAGTVYAILEDSKGALWIGTGTGLNQFEPESETFIQYTTNPETPNSLGNNTITALCEDQNQNLWIGTFDNGLNRYNLESDSFIRYISEPEKSGSLSHSSVMSIYQDSKSILWVATAGGGLNRYHPESDSFTSYTEKNGLPSNVIYGILEDNDGYLWLTTNFGLSRFDPEMETFRNYTAKDGLQSNEFNQNSFAKGIDEKFYIGGINGFNVFDPSLIKDSDYAPPIVLTSFSYSDEASLDSPKTELLRNISLTWPNNGFSFEFASLSFANPAQNQYAYMLENFDTGWNYIGTKREGRYTNLPGGTYNLRLKGTNNDGIWNETGQIIKITIIPPFWQTWPFRILVAFAIVGIGLAVYTIRIRAFHASNLQLERLVHERTSALRKQTDEMEALYAGGEKIIRALTLDQVFHALVDAAVNMLHADRSVVFTWDEKQTRVVPRVSHGFSEETLKVLHFAKGEGVIGDVLATGETVVVHELQSEELRPEVRAAIVAEGILSFVHLPIIVNDEIIGIFNVGFSRPDAITDNTVRLFTALVQRGALSIENMQLFEQTKELAVIEERNRVARDLHDSAKQKAFAALAQLGTVSGILKRDPSNANFHLNEAENLVYEVIQELTFLIQEMYPMALKEKGLATTLREYVFEWENRNGVTIDLLIENPKRMKLETEQAIYRIIQEALANVARHSQSENVGVSLAFNGQTVKVVVSDDGVGFDVKRKANGMGLRTIKERAESIGGEVLIESAPGEGTQVIITVPFNGVS